MASTSVKALNLDECTAQFDVSPHDEHPRVLKNIVINVSHPSHHPDINTSTGLQVYFGADHSESDDEPEPTEAPLATLRALRITRSAARGEFHLIMDEDSDELHQFSVQLFDNDVNVRPWLFDGTKGSGCWGKEVDHGDLVYVMDLDVHPDVSRFHPNA
jgi:hypothetical protein